jgi:hypothetical protein
MVLAVATQNTVALYDTQQAEPFAKISKIHYIGLNDLAWSVLFKNGFLSFEQPPPSILEPILQLTTTLAL